MTVKELFDKAENGTLNWEQFQASMGQAKFVDLSEGHYVSKQKFDDEVSQRDTRINDLQTSVTSRDNDLVELQAKLKEAGDVEVLKQASKDLAELQKKYDKETKAYQEQLSKQAYEFAVRDFASGKNFSSNAAKRDFIQSMIAKNLTLEDGKIIGAEDFVQIYSKDNADAFVTVKKEEPKPQFTSGSGDHKPSKLSLSEMMKMKNDNPDATFDF